MPPFRTVSWPTQTLVAALLLGGLSVSPAMGQGWDPQDSAMVIPSAPVPLAPSLAAPIYVPIVPQHSVPLPDPKPFARWSVSVHALRDSIVTFAERQLGTPYHRGATSPTQGFDCSGFVTYVMSHFNVALPRTARQQARVGRALARDVTALRPGDLLTFGHGSHVSHIGIYIGNGRFIHASNPHDGVKISALSGRIAHWWHGARRVVLNDSTVWAASNAD